MKLIFSIFFLIAINCSCKKSGDDYVATTVIANQSKNFTYLALGDSYTIGQSVPPQENFPNQTVRLLKRDSLFGSLKIIATTGWTTSDLLTAINQDTTRCQQYDIVSLLIGVNNQYRGLTIADYGPAFETLLKKAIVFSGNMVKRVIVFSIPDWGVTPFANGRDRVIIAQEIDAYNAINKAIAARYGVYYIDITPWTREAADDPSLLEPFGLHPSGKEYARWAVKLQEIIKVELR